MSRIRIVCGLIAVFLAFAIVLTQCGSEQEVVRSLAPPPPDVTATPTLTPTVEVPQVATPTTTSESTDDALRPEPREDVPDSVTATATQPPESTHQPEPPEVVIPQSAPTWLHQPDIGLNVRVLELPEENRSPVNPPSYMEAYWDPEPLVVADGKAESYALGTSTPNLATISAHTGIGEAAFNPLYDWRTAEFQLEVGDEVWVKTELSGDTWLVYELQSQLFVAKDMLAESEEVWGMSAKPNTLLLIGCRQIDEQTNSQENIVLEFVFTGTHR